jgi:pimeloyl-ACP methyl ester carboxylesterase
MECKIKNISLNYEIIGEGKPIVMLHGYYADHRLMTGCMEPIFADKREYKRIYLDLPGMGKSESAEWIRNSDDLLYIIVDFIEKILPKEKFLLVGQSYGGYLSRGIIYKMAGRVDGILLICPVIIPEYNNREVEQHAVLEKDMIFLSKLKREEVEAFNLVVHDWLERTGEIYGYK